MSIVEVKEPLVLLNDELCWFVLKSPNISNLQAFHVILTDLSDKELQAVKGFFLLLKKCSETNRSRTRAISVCLTIDFSIVTNEKLVGVYNSLLQNIGPEVTELRFSGLERSSYTNSIAHPFSVSNPILLSTLNFPHLHTVRVSNLGWRENILWLSYFLNAATNLKQLHIGPFDDVYIQGLGKWEIDGYSLLSSSAKFGSENEVRVEQLQLLGQCVNFEEMPQAQLFIKGLWSSAFCSKKWTSIRKNLDGKAEAEMGIGVPLSTKIQVQVKVHEKCDDSSVNILCKSPSLVALSGLGFYTPEPTLSSSFQVLQKLEIESTPIWLMENLRNLPTLKHLVWTPAWIPQIKNLQNCNDYCDDYFENDVIIAQVGPKYSQQMQYLNIEALKMIENLLPRIGRQSHNNLEIFRISHDWKTCKSLPENAFQIIKLFSSSFPHLKILSCEVSESDQAAAFRAHFPQVKEFHFNKYVPITEVRMPVRLQAEPATRIQYNSQPQMSYKLENFRQKMTSFKSQVEKFQNTCSKDVGRKIKIGAFIYDESMQLFQNGQYRQGIELNVPEICSAISNLNLSEIIIPVQYYGEAEQILEAIKSSGPKDLKHVHFQLMKSNSNSDSYPGIPQQVIDSYKPFFLVTNDFEPGQNTLNCSSLAKDFWE